MLLVGQLILTLVLTKGEICPGQRGRVHKLLPVIGVLWLAVTSLHIEAFLIAATIFYFFSKVQTKKTRDKGPIWLLYIADALAVIYVAVQIHSLSSISAGLGWISIGVLLGTIFANLLLLMARSRLDAFHRILPITGILSGIVVAIIIALQVVTLNQDLMVSLQNNILTGLFFLILGLLIWPLHMITSWSVNKFQLSLTLMVLLSSGFYLYPLLIVSVGQL